MLTFLKLSRRCRVVLAEKTDRLYRNLNDWVTIDGFVWSCTSSRRTSSSPHDSRSSEVHARHPRADGEELHRTMGRGRSGNRSRPRPPFHLRLEHKTDLARFTNRIGATRILALPDPATSVTIRVPGLRAALVVVDRTEDEAADLVVPAQDPVGYGEHFAASVATRGRQQHRGPVKDERRVACE